MALLSTRMNSLTRGLLWRCYSDFPKDGNSKFKYWEQEYSSKEEMKDKDPYHLMYEGKAKRALLSHVDSEGRAKMVDVSGKVDTVRSAVAMARWG